MKNALFKTLIILLLLRSADSFAQTSIKRKADRPNILLIWVDDLRSDELENFQQPRP
jgi:hypothetical protein